MSARISSRGYEVQTVEVAKGGLLCSECGLILREAVQTPEGLRLCQQCYNQIQELVHLNNPHS